MEMMPTIMNMPDAAAGPQLNGASTLSSAGDTKLFESKFAAVVTKVLEAQKTSGNAGKTTGLINFENILKTEDILNLGNVLQTLQASPRSEDHKDKGITDNNGLNTGALLFSMIRATIGENAEDQKVSLADQLNDDAETDAQADGSETAAYSEQGLKAGFLLNNLKGGLLVDLNSDQQREATFSQPEASQDIYKNGLKMGASLYAMMSNLVGNGAENSQLNALNQCSGEKQTCKNETKEISAHGLKAGLFAAKHGDDKRAGITDPEGILTALNQEDSGDKTESIFGKLSDLAEHNSSNNNDLTLRKSSHDKRDTAAFNLPDNNKEAGRSGTKTNLETALIKEINNKVPAQEVNGSAKTAELETASGSHNMFNHSGLTAESGRQTEGLTSGSAARPSGFNQLVDNVVYVIKSNSKLGVTVEHEGLGKVNINLNMDKGVLNVQINTTEKTVREFIENNVQQIVDSLAKDGVSIGGFSVSLKDHRDNNSEKFIADNNHYNGNQEQEGIREEAKISAVSGLVNVFA